MYLYQFLADPSGPKPVVFELAQLNTSIAESARTAYQPIAHVSGQWDAFGSEQSPFDPWEMTISGMATCRSDRSREPAFRAARRLLGQRGWILAYRFEGCACPKCGSDCGCGYALEHEASVVWYGTTGRLLKIEGPSVQGDGFEYGVAAWSPQLSFTIDRPWERLTGRHWGFGDLKISVDGNRQQLGVSVMSELIEYRYPPRSMTRPPSHGYWWRLPHAKIARYPFVEDNCVSNWSSGGWVIGYAAKVNRTPEPTQLYVPGDWPPDVRLAFTNFSTLVISFKHNGVTHTTCAFNEVVTSPQFLYIDGTTGETSVRFCPVSDDPCMDLVGLATYVPEAGEAVPAAVSFTAGNGLSLLRPGWNEITVHGHHAPGNEFRWAYDIVSLWS